MIFARTLFGIALATSLAALTACTTSSTTPEPSAALESALSTIVQNDEADIAAIQTLYRSWHQAVEAGDIAGYVASLDDNVRLMPPGAAPIEGAMTYAKFLEPVFATATYRIEVLQPASIQIAGDMAVAEYEYVIHLALKNPEQQITEPGALTASRTQAQYFDVLRRQANGDWRVWRHTWRASPAE